MPTREPYDYLLLTALAEEDAALSEALHAVKARDPERARYPGAPSGLRWAVEHSFGTLRVLTAALYGMGEEKAREWTRLLLQCVEPQFVGLIGIAGAANPAAEFGQILLAERIWYYEPAKITPTGIEDRGAEHRTEGLLIDRLRHTDRGKLQQLFPETGPWGPPLVGVIASGEKVVAHDGVKDEILKRNWKVIGFEMEGHGFANEVVRALGSEKWFMVRSVSDRADKTKSDDYRKLACSRAAQYAVGFMLDSDLCVPHQATAAAIHAADRRASAPAGDSQLLQLMNALAIAFAERAPDDFLAIVERTIGAAIPTELRVAQAIAHWRRDDAGSCRAVCEELLQGVAGHEPLSSSATVAARLLAWSLLRLGEAAAARKLLEKRFGAVADLSERGRWADLLAQCCRFGDTADQALALSWYAQARLLKAEGGDYFGEVIALQQMARACLERFDYDGCEAYYREATAVTASRDFPQRTTCDVTSQLGLTWLDLIARGDLNLRLARRRLAHAGALLRDLPAGALERDLRAAAAAMSNLLEVLMGATNRAVGWQDVNAMWATVVYGQVRVQCGEDPGVVTNDVMQQATGRPSIAPRAIPGLLALFKPTEPPPRCRGITAVECQFWPLSEWVRLAMPGDGVRVIEGLVSLYSLIVERLVAGDAPERREASLGLDKLVTALAHFGHEHPKLALAREVAAVATIVRQAIPLRNRWAHALPGGADAGLAADLDRFAASALREARLLRSAAWIDDTAIEMGGERIDLAPAVEWEPATRTRTIRFSDRTSYAQILASMDAGGGAVAI